MVPKQGSVTSTRQYVESTSLRTREQVATPHLKTILLGAFLLLAAGEFVVRGPLRFFREGYRWSDVSQVYLPAANWIHGRNPYDPADFVARCKEVGINCPPATDIRTHSPYPLTTLVVMSPLAALPWPAAHIAWTFALTLAPFSIVWALSRVQQVSTSQRYWFLGMVLALAPLHTGISVGNVSVLSISLCALALWTHASGHEIVTGLLLALGGCFKPQLGIWFVLYFLIRRRWKTVWASAGFGILLLIVGILRLQLNGVDWLQSFLNNAREFSVSNPTVQFATNDPIRFTLLNLQVPLYSWFGRVAIASAVSWVISALLLGIWIGVVLKTENRTPRVLGISALLIASLLPSYHRNYDALLLAFPLCWVVSGRWSRRMRLAVFALTVPFFIPGPALLRVLADRGRIPAGLTQSGLWKVVIMPHETWALLALAVLLLYAMATSVTTACGTTSDTALRAGDLPSIPQ